MYHHLHSGPLEQVHCRRDENRSAREKLDRMKPDLFLCFHDEVLKERLVFSSRLVCVEHASILVQNSRIHDADSTDDCEHYYWNDIINTRNLFCGFFKGHHR